MVAELWRLRFTRLRSWIAPVTNSPSGTTTLPPPAWWHAAIALWKAAVQSVLLSPRAPNFKILNSRSGNWGAVIRARMRGTCSQGPRSSGDTAEVLGRLGEIGRAHV